MMWFITIAFEKGGNKKFSNWVANLRLRHKEILVGLTTILLKGMGEGWFREWGSRMTTKD
jgi:hypothetical protein